MTTHSVYCALFQLAAEDHRRLDFLDHLGPSCNRSTILSMIVLAWIGGSWQDSCWDDADLLDCLRLGDWKFAACKASDDAVLAELEGVKNEIAELEQNSKGRGYLLDHLKWRATLLPVPDWRHNRDGH